MMGSVKMIKRRVITMKKILFMLLLSIAGCATSTQSNIQTAAEIAAEKGYTLGEEVQRINNYRVSGWNYASDRALIITGSPNEKYLLTLNTPCYELRTTQVIGYTTTVNNVLARFDSVIVKSNSGVALQKCPIDRIYRITKE